LTRSISFQRQSFLPTRFTTINELFRSKPWIKSTTANVDSLGRHHHLWYGRVTVLKRQALIERAQFAQDMPIYLPGQFDFQDNFQGSFVEWMLYETEKLHAKVRRFTSPDENPFSHGELPEPILPALAYPTLLHEPVKINANGKLLDIYIKEIIPSLCKSGDDLQYGSASTKDVQCLEALSRRIHYGTVPPRWLTWSRKVYRRGKVLGSKEPRFVH